MAQFNLRDFKKQASFFLRERLKDARLALMDVSRIQLLTEEATNEDPWGPEVRTMAMLAEAAFELGEYGRIVQVIHNRLEGGMQRPWRQLYKTLVLLEYLLKHGPASMGKEFRDDIFLIEELSLFNLADTQGVIDRGAIVRKSADRVLELLNDPELWKEERNRTRKLSVGIQGFGSSRNQVPAGQNQEDESLSPLSSKMSAQTTSTDMCRMSNGKDPVSMSSVSGQDGFVSAAVEQNVMEKPFKKSLSSLGYLRERLPQLSRQIGFPKEEASDLESSRSLLARADEDVVDTFPSPRRDGTSF